MTADGWLPGAGEGERVDFKGEQEMMSGGQKFYYNCDDVFPHLTQLPNSSNCSLTVGEFYFM